LTFIKCNLKNVEIDPSWTVIDSLTIHAKEVEILDKDKTYISHQVEKDGKFEEVSREEIVSGDIDIIK